MATSFQEPHHEGKDRRPGLCCLGGAPRACDYVRACNEGMGVCGRGSSSTLSSSCTPGLGLLSVGPRSQTTAPAGLGAVSQQNRPTHTRAGQMGPKQPLPGEVWTRAQGKHTVARMDASGQVGSARRRFLKPSGPKKDRSPHDFSAGAPFLELPELSNETVSIKKSSGFLAVWGKHTIESERPAPPKSWRPLRG